MGAEFPDFGQKIGNGQDIGGGLPHAGVGSQIRRCIQDRISLFSDLFLIAARVRFVGEEDVKEDAADGEGEDEEHPSHFVSGGGIGVDDQNGDDDICHEDDGQEEKDEARALGGIGDQAEEDEQSKGHQKQLGE